MTTVVEVHRPAAQMTNNTSNELPAVVVVHTEIVPVIEPQSQSLELLRVPPTRSSNQFMHRSRATSPVVASKQSVPPLPTAKTSRKNSIQQDAEQKVLV